MPALDDRRAVLMLVACEVAIVPSRILWDTISMGRRAGSRSYPQSYKRRVVSEKFESGRSVAAVPRNHGSNANKVFCWVNDWYFDAGERKVRISRPQIEPWLDGLPIRELMF